MRRVTSAEFVRHFSALCDEALAEPLVLTRNGRDRLVVLSMEQFRQIEAKGDSEGSGAENVSDARSRNGHSGRHRPTSASAPASDF